MASVGSNQHTWQVTYDWTQAGEEWSVSWGNSQLEWSVTLFPRIRAFVPTGTILEIAPGYGRWTQYLKNYCDRLIVVDMSARCIEACRARFADASHIEYPRERWQVARDGARLLHRLRVQFRLAGACRP